MAEYIKREAVIDLITRRYENSEICTQEINSIPAADVAPVVHGRWGTGRFNLETGNYEEQCTRCRNFSKEYGKPHCPQLRGEDGRRCRPCG